MEVKDSAVSVVHRVADWISNALPPLTNRPTRGSRRSSSRLPACLTLGACVPCSSLYRGPDGADEAHRLAPGNGHDSGGQDDPCGFLDTWPWQVQERSKSICYTPCAATMPPDQQCRPSLRSPNSLPNALTHCEPRPWMVKGSPGPRGKNRALRLNQPICGHS